MPFTASHVVAILPIARQCRQIPFSALAIGSMIPDLPLFVPIVTYGQTHDPTQVFKMGLPLGLAAFVLFQLFLKIPLISLFPRFIQTRIVPYSSARLQLSFVFWLLVVVGIVIGAYSHILWDSFTHPNRWGTQVVAPGLNQIINVAGRPMPIYKLLQHLSSVLGLATLALLATSLVV